MRSACVSTHPNDRDMHMLMIPTIHSELASSAKHHAPPSYQLHLDSQSTETEVWILLLRHYVPNEAGMKNKPPIALHVTEEDDMLDSASWKIEDADQVCNAPHWSLLLY